jgi:4-amino-4-deoxy-L-arabinose transferase-like glycosyltransferase
VKIDSIVVMTKRWFLPALLLIGTIAVMALLAVIVIPTRGPFRWDEATHALKGLVIAHDLSHGDLLSFAYNSYRQVLYPPLFSWFLAFGFLTAGPSAVTVSWTSLLFFALGALLMWFAGAQLERQVPAISAVNITGAMAALLWLTSPPLLEYATQGMLEIPGLTTMSLTLVVALKLLNDDQPVGTSPREWMPVNSQQSAVNSQVGSSSPREWMLLGLLVSLTFLMRPQYGIIVGLALAVTLLIHTRGRLWRAQIFYALLPLVVILGVWFAYTPKIPSTMQWLINMPDGVDEPYSVEGWLFYPLAVVRNSGSPWLFAFYIVTFLWAWIKRRSPGVNLLVALVILLFTISMFHHNKQARYLFPMLPAFFLLGGYGIAEFWRWAQQRSPVWRVLAVFGLLLLLVQSGILLQATIKPGPGPRPDPTTAYLVEQIDQATNTLVIGSMEMSYPGAPLLDWKLSAEAGLLAPPQAGAAVQIDEGRRLGNLAARLPLSAWLSERVGQVVTAYDQPARVHTLYAQLPLRASYSQNVKGYSSFVADLIDAQAIDQVLIIYRTSGRVNYGRDYLAAPLAAAGWSMADAQEMSDVHMRVEVWRP